MDIVNEKLEERFIRQAMEEAQRVKTDIPVGCVIVHDGQVIARARNMREETGDPTAHAEIVAMREAALALGRWRLTGCTLYTTLEPCPMCAEALLQARVERLVFGAYDIKSGAAGSAFNLFSAGRIYPIPEILGGICEKECESLLLQFFRTATREAKHAE